MSLRSRDLDLSERVGSDIWWKLKTGWTDTEYLSRKNALLTRVREKWVKTEGSMDPRHISKGIESLVITFDDSNWYLPGEPDRFVAFAEQLRIYTKWADILRIDRKLMSSNKPYTMPVSDINLSIPLLAKSKSATVATPSRPADTDQGSVTLLTSNTATVAAETRSSCTAKNPFDWDDVEMYINWKAGEVQRWYYIPMVDLKSGDPEEPYHWYDFAFDRYADVLELETGGGFDPLKHSVFWVEGNQWVRIETPGDYRTMLKRFSEGSGKNVINMRVQKTLKGNPPTGFYSATPRSLKRKAPIE